MNKRIIPIRLKLMGLISLLIIIFSLFIFYFFPARLENQAKKALVIKAQAICEISAFGVAPALVFDDWQAAREALEGLNKLDDLVYAEVRDISGNQVVSISDNLREKELSEHREGENYFTAEVYHACNPVIYDNRRIGNLCLGLSLDNLNLEIADSKSLITTVSLLFLLIGTGAISLISYYITRPLRQMMGAVEKISGGDLSQRASIKSRDEVGYLAGAFDRMVENLEKAYLDLSMLNLNLEARIRERTEKLEREITERSLAEEALKVSESNYRTLVENTTDVIVRFDSQGKIIYVSPNIDTYFQGTSLKLSKDRPGRTRIDRALRESWQKHLDTVLENGKPCEAEFEYVANKVARIYSLRLFPESDAQGRLSTVIGVIRDVTDIKFIESERARAAKLESIGVLAGGIAHDFNNILVAILGNISLIRMFGSLDEESNELLEEAEKASLRAKGLTQQLLTFSKGGAPIKKVVSLENLIQETSVFILSGSQVNVEFSFEKELRRVEVDEDQFNQVLSNLLINADQAMPQGGTVKVSAGNVDTEAQSRLNLPHSRFVEIAIRDRGLGIPEEHLQKIFDPYFTTKQKGSGLGLATAYSIIKRHGGLITVESAPGRGATFFIYLPATDKPGEKEEKSSLPVRELSPKRILVMDDEAGVRKVAGRMLKNLGHSVETAADGSETLKLYLQRKDEGRPFDLVILDLTVPGGLGGKETIKKLLELDGQASVIVSSGFSTDPVIAEYKKYGFKNVIPKPYKVENLKLVLNDVFSSQESENPPPLTAGI